VATSFSDLIADGGIRIGDGSKIKSIKKGTVSIDPTGIEAGTEVDVAVKISGVAEGDIVQLMPPNAAMEPGIAILAVWVSEADTVKVRIGNLNPAVPLSGGAQNWTYLHTDLT
jgi:hypothetical protein